MASNIVIRPGIGITGRILQTQSFRVSRLVGEQPLLNFVRHGHKVLHAPGLELTISSGQAVVVAAHQAFDIINRLDPIGHFEANWLVWDPSLIARFASQPRHSRLIERAMPLGTLSAQMAASIDAAIDAIRNPDDLPDAVAEHRLLEVLTWIDALGGHISAAVPTQLTARVRQHISAAPGENWTSPLVSEQMAMSEATLRRRLADEGTSFGVLLADIRMSRALQLLQSSTMPVTQIAMEVGYESASRFAVRFRHRFGFAPSTVRGHRRDLVAAE